jgi:hypothetical protein
MNERYVSLPTACNLACRYGLWPPCRPSPPQTPYSHRNFSFCCDRCFFCLISVPCSLILWQLNSESVCPVFCEILSPDVFQLSWLHNIRTLQEYYVEHCVFCGAHLIYTAFRKVYPLWRCKKRKRSYSVGPTGKGWSLLSYTESGSYRNVWHEGNHKLPRLNQCESGPKFHGSPKHSRLQPISLNNTTDHY